MLRAFQFITGYVILIGAEIVRLFFGTSSEFSIYILDNLFYFRTIGVLIIVFPVIQFMWFGNKPVKVIIIAALLLYLALRLV
jgi:hypothetical protein